MRRVLFSLIYMLLSAASAQSPLFVDEATLPAFMLDQKDVLFYSQGILGPGDRSSLCGPTSVMNWLQLRQQNAYSKIQLVNFIQVIGVDLRSQNVQINHGLTEFQLLQFLEIYNNYLEETKNYVLRKQNELSLAELLSDKPQLLMIHYREPVRFSPGRPHREDFKVPISGAHWVLKVGAVRQSAELMVIDPENPHRITRLFVEEVLEHGASVFRIRPKSKNDLNTFIYRVPLVWSLTSLIEEN